jgi:hypothetical protein
LKTKSHLRVEPLGADPWDIRAGFLYMIYGAKQMKIILHDTEGNPCKMKVEEDKSLQEFQDIVRSQYNIPPWHKIMIKHSDGAPFWIEENQTLTPDLF